MKTGPQRVGRWGEQFAAEYLERQGYRIIERNARTAYGELDLVVSPTDEAVVVFVEVKTRRSTAFGLPEASITEQKKAHLLAAGQAYLLEHPDLPGDWRVDVIAIQLHSGKERPEVFHFENALTGN